jgi:hypothetical protein
MKTSLFDQFILLEAPQRGSKRWGFFRFSPCAERLQSRQASYRRRRPPRRASSVLQVDQTALCRDRGAVLNVATKGAFTGQISYAGRDAAESECGRLAFS